MPEPMTCPKCGARLPPDGTCTRCSIDSAFASPSPNDAEPISWLDALEAEGAPVGRYELLGEVARGGMGVIYRARDRSLNRIVALKMILPQQLQSPGALDRFRAEAEAVAALDHPGILPIYEVGELDGLPFFSMKFVEGGSLVNFVEQWRDRRRDAAELIAHIARAVHHAHERGVLHRDLKPGNILLGHDNTSYVADFGIAKWLARDTRLTLHESSLGTPHYIAPEQAAGGPVKLTPAADVYSLGAILYELLTGRPPFTAETALAVIRLVIDTAPLPPRTLNAAIPRDLELICLKCLEKEPSARYGSAAALAEDLERWLAGRSILARSSTPVLYAWHWVKRNRPLASLSGALLVALVAVALFLYERPRKEGSTSPMGPEKSIAVLPFENISGDPNNAYFAEGIQGEILARLSKIAALKVISRTFTQGFKSAPANLHDIAQQLGVANVLKGSIQKAGDRVRVHVELIRAMDGSPLWAETYDRELTDIFRVESDVASAIAATLRARLTGTETDAIATRPTTNQAAHQLYLKGRYFWNKTTAGDIRKAIDYFTQATAADPNYAPAYAGLADAYSLLPYLTGASPQECAPKAKAAAEKALAIDDTLAEAHIALGEAIRSSEFDFDTAGMEFRRGLELDPNYANGHWHYSWLLAALGKTDEAIAEIKRALEPDPLSLIINTDLGFFYILTGRYDEAIDQLRRTLEMDPNFYYAHGNLGEVYALKGSFDASIAEIRRAQELNDDPFILVLLTYAYATSGNRTEARGTMDKLSEIGRHRYVQAYGLAVCHLALGERAEALNWLEKAYQDHDAAALGVMRIDPFLAPLRRDPTFERLAQKVVPMPK